MRNASKIGWRLFLKAFFMLTLLVPTQAGFSSVPAAWVTCPEPSPSVTSQSSGSVSFSWSAVSGALNYKVWYHRKGDNYTSSEFSADSNTISFSSLPSGTYDFYFVTVCTDGSSGYVVIQDIILG